ncbi:hypothetical protein DFJ77DRAFT_518461 [Powellomyces hirtus]|nr:hypothetical protein DFJ77DRAFT_518461 [Powellomyces hirtus]
MLALTGDLAHSGVMLAAISPLYDDGLGLEFSHLLRGILLDAPLLNYWILGPHDRFGQFVKTCTTKDRIAFELLTYSLIVNAFSKPNQKAVNTMDTGAHGRSHSSTSPSFCIRSPFRIDVNPVVQAEGAAKPGLEDNKGESGKHGWNGKLGFLDAAVRFQVNEAAYVKIEWRDSAGKKPSHKKRKADNDKTPVQSSTTKPTQEKPKPASANSKQRPTIPIAIPPPALQPLSIPFSQSAFDVFLQVQQFLYRFATPLGMPAHVVDALSDTSDWAAAACTDAAHALLDILILQAQKNEKAARNTPVSATDNPNATPNSPAAPILPALPTAATSRRTGKWSQIADLLDVRHYAPLFSTSSDNDDHDWSLALTELRTLRTVNSLDRVPFAVLIACLHTLVTLVQQHCPHLIRDAVEDALTEYNALSKQLRLCDAAAVKAHADYETAEQGFQESIKRTKKKNIKSANGANALTPHQRKRDAELEKLALKARGISKAIDRIRPQINRLGEDRWGNEFWMFPLHDGKIYVYGSGWPPPSLATTTSASSNTSTDTNGIRSASTPNEWASISTSEARTLAQFFRQENAAPTPKGSKSAKTLKAGPSDPLIDTLTEIDRIIYRLAP